MSDKITTVGKRMSIKYTTSVEERRFMWKRIFYEVGMLIRCHGEMYRCRSFMSQPLCYVSFATLIKRRRRNFYDGMKLFNFYSE